MDEQQPDAQIERWFVRRGVPHFIAAYSPAEDVLTRTLPVLTLVFLFSAISAVDLDWSTGRIVLASLGGLALLLTAWAVLNRWRGRPRFARPDRVGRVELSVFLFVPTMLPLLFGGDVTGAFLTFGTLLLILAAVYVVTSYALVSLSVWAINQILHTLGQTLNLFARSLPLLLLGFMFLFINAEAWQSAGRVDRGLLLAVIGLFAFLATIFLVTQVLREMAGLNQFDSWDEVETWVEDAPIDVKAVERSSAPSPPPLTRREKGNLFLVFMVSQTFRVLLVSTLIGALFVVLGLLIVRPDTISLWTTEPVNVVWEFTIAGKAMTFTEELLQVSAFLAAFAAVYFSVYTTTDQTLREEFFEDTVSEARQNLAVRTAYRAA